MSMCLGVDGISLSGDGSPFPRGSPGAVAVRTPPALGVGVGRAAGPEGSCFMSLIADRLLVTGTRRQFVSRPRGRKVFSLPVFGTD